MSPNKFIFRASISLRIESECVVLSYLCVCVCLAMPEDRIPKVAMRWTPSGRRQAKNQLAEDSDERAGRDGSYMGRGAGQSTGQVCMAKFCYVLMSQTGRRG